MRSTASVKRILAERGCSCAFLFTLAYGVSEWLGWIDCADAGMLFVVGREAEENGDSEEKQPREERAVEQLASPAKDETPG